MKKIIGTLIMVALAMTVDLRAGQKKEAQAAAAAAPGPHVSAAGRPANGPRFGGQRFNGQRFGNAGMYRGAQFPNAQNYSPATVAALANARARNWQPRSLPEADTTGGASAPAPRSRPTRDAADDIISTIPRHRHDGAGRNTGVNVAGTSNGGETPVTGQGSPNANIPAANVTPNRHRAGDGRSIVPFNNNGNVNFNDASGRCRDWHNHGGDRNWWHRRCPVIILIGGGYWGWNDGWWYPAWGYSSVYSSYAYNGPIYGYDGLPPDQVIANVQGALQELGYFQYAIDGVFGPATQAAIADYQRDNGLYVTGAIDRSTLVTLGFIL